jgi:hypothetical protein
MLLIARPCDIGRMSGAIGWQEIVVAPFPQPGLTAWSLSALQGKSLFTAPNIAGGGRSVPELKAWLQWEALSFLTQPTCTPTRSGKTFSKGRRHGSICLPQLWWIVCLFLLRSLAGSADGFGNSPPVFRVKMRAVA